MAFFTHYLKSIKRAAGLICVCRCWFAVTMVLATLFALLCAQMAFAEGASAKSARLELGDEGYQLTADFDLDITPALQEAVRKGVPLYFLVEFELSQKRWYWLDKAIVKSTRDRRIAYAPLTEQYRVTVSGYSQNLATFEEVKRNLSSVRSWVVAEKNQLIPGMTYQAAVRIRLDTSQLPKPFQLDVIGSKEWSLASDWFRWSVTP